MANHRRVLNIVIAVICAPLILGGILFLIRSGAQDKDGTASNVKMVDGRQIIDVTAKGGYQPAMTTAKAGVPTVLRVRTSGTFDCSSALVVPQLNVSKNLPPAGVTEVPIPAQESGAVVQAMCSMGMYNFAIKFE
jgi:plastocyanin domain-containing protein